MQQIGLHKLDPEKLEYGDAGNAIAAIFNEIEQGIDKNRINHHYTFGWTGLLSPQQRYYDAHELLCSWRIWSESMSIPIKQSLKYGLSATVMGKH